MTQALELDAVTLRYGHRPVIDALSLAIAPGDVLALMGPSGCGKSSLLRLLLGFESPECGSVRIAGVQVTANGRLLVPPEERNLAVVFQDLALWPHLDVAEHLGFCLRSRRIPKTRCASLTNQMLTQVGLEARAHSYPHELSGGERRRVALARALVVEPRAILFDEPLANLDVALRNDLLPLLRAQLKASGASAIYVTHDPREAVQLCDRVAVLERGRIVQSGPLREVCANPATPFVHQIARDLFPDPCTCQSLKESFS